MSQPAATSGHVRTGPETVTGADAASPVEGGARRRARSRAAVSLQSAPASNRSPRLLYVTASAVQDGTAVYTHVTGIVAGLRHRGWQVDVRSSRALPLDGVMAQFRRLLDTLRAQAGSLRRLTSYDAVYCRWHFALAPVALCARLRGIPVAQEINGPYADYFIAHPYMTWVRRGATRSMRMQLKWADLLLPVTEGLKNWALREVGTGRIEVVPNGVDAARFAPGAGSTLCVPRPYAIFAGSLSRWQGIETLIEAFESSDWPSGVHLVIAGDGVLRSVVESAASRCGLTYLGSIAHRDVPGLIAGSQMCVTPQNNAGGRADTGLSALKLFEALACAVPVIASDTPGHRETLLEYECGLLFPVGDASALAGAARWLSEHSDRARAMGLRGRAFVEREASWDSRANTVDALLSALIRRA